MSSGAETNDNRSCHLYDHSHFFRCDRALAHHKNAANLAGQLWQLAVSTRPIRLCGWFFICLRRSFGRNWRFAFVWRGSGHDDSLGLSKGERLDGIQIAGLVAAMTGLTILVFPG